MKYYITRTVGGIPLYFDGEIFQQHQSAAARYDFDEAQQEIADKDLQYAELSPIDAGWMQVNDAARKMIGL